MEEFKNTVFAKLLSDRVIKALFYSPQRVHLLAGIIRTFVPEAKIDSLYIHNNEQHGEASFERLAINDIYTSTPDHVYLFICEFQNKQQEFFSNRMLFYSVAPIRDQIAWAVAESERKARETGERKGKFFKFELHNIYVISIVNFRAEHVDPSVFDDETGAISRYSIRSDKGNELYTKSLRFVQIELPRFSYRLGEHLKCRSLLEKVLYTFLYAHQLKERPENFNEDLLVELYDGIRIANMSPEDYKKYEAAMKSDLSMEATIGTALRHAEQEKQKALDAAAKEKAEALDAAAKEKAEALDAAAKEKAEALDAQQQKAEKEKQTMMRHVVAILWEKGFTRKEITELLKSDYADIEGLLAAV